MKDEERLALFLKKIADKALNETKSIHAPCSYDDECGCWRCNEPN